MSNDVRFIARPAYEQPHFDQSFDGQGADVDSISEVAISSLSSSEDEKSPVKKPRQKIRVLTPNPKLNPSGDKGSRRTPVDSYADTGTPVKDDRRKDNTWNPNVPRTDISFTFICPPKKTRKPHRIVEIPTESISVVSDKGSDNNVSVKDTSSPLSDDNSSPNTSVLPLTDDNSSPKAENKLSESTEESFDGSFDFSVDHGGGLSVLSTPKHEKLAIELGSPGGTYMGTYNLTPNSRENFRMMLNEQREKDNTQ